jgi:hypothetical protein
MRIFLLSILFLCAGALSAQTYWSPDPPLLPEGSAGQHYRVEFKMVYEGVEAQSYSARNGSLGTIDDLPPGLTLSQDGVLSGTPTTPNSGYNFEIVAHMPPGAAFSQHVMFYSIGIIQRDGGYSGGSSSGGCAADSGSWVLVILLLLLVVGAIIVLRDDNEE